MLSSELKRKLSCARWLIEQKEFDEKRNLSFESIFSLSNGYMGVRGSFIEGKMNSLPTTMINGVFDKSETFMRELVNLPNWLSTKFNIEKEVLSFDHCEVSDFYRVLDMKKAYLTRSVIFTDQKGRRTRIETMRFLSRAHKHLALMEIRITPLNYSGILEIRNEMDGSVLNLADAPRFTVKHFIIEKNESLQKDDGVYLEGKLRDDQYHFGCGSILVNEDLDHRAFSSFGEISSEFKDLRIEKGKTVILHKYACYYTEKDLPKNIIKSTIQKELLAVKKRGFQEELKAHINIYQKMWEDANITIKGDDELDRSIRFCIFQLMSTASEDNSYVNIGSKLLSGEEYGGHAFWDTELFMLPFFNYIFPKTARNLEMYRYHLLDAARENARKTGYQGARYPWESADEGSEQCPDWTIYPDGHAEPCFVAKYEQHVTSAVAYGILDYVKVTGDKSYLYNYGLEILIETARFWASRFEYNQKKDRYEINNVTGPDEWHEPVNNNLYTNYLAKWNLEIVYELIEKIKSNKNIFNKVKNKTKLKDAEIKKWKDIAPKIYLPRKKNSKLLEQFEGYFKLEDIIIEKYDKNDWPIKPERFKEGNREKTCIIKQADVVMLMYLLADQFDEETIKENYHYYEKRTLHGSSLSPSIYSIMGLRVGDESKAYRYLKRAANLDLDDIQGNGREGLHGANLGGVWQVVVFGFGGISIQNDILHINPKLPKKWKSLNFNIHYQGRKIKVNIDNGIKVKRLSGNPLDIVIKDRRVKI